MRIGRRMQIILVLAVASAGLFGAWRQSVSARDDREAALQRSLLRAWARAETGAGISIVPKQVPAADDRDLKRLEELAGFHEYAMRCSSCHVLPDPAVHTAGQWTGKVDDMRYYIGRAGVMPPAEAELNAADEFLRRASEELRRDQSGR